MKKSNLSKHSRILWETNTVECKGLSEELAKERSVGFTRCEPGTLCAYVGTGWFNRVISERKKESVVYRRIGRRGK